MFNTITEPYDEKKMRGVMIPVFFENEGSLSYEPPNVYRHLTQEDYLALEKTRRYQAQRPKRTEKP